MSLMQELVGQAIAGKVENDETATSVLGALANCDRLGAALWRLQCDMLPSTFHRAEDLLSERLTETRPVPAQYKAIARTAVYQFMDRACGLCDGTGKKKELGEVRSCPCCSGEGVRCHSKAESEKVSGMSHEEFKPWYSVLVRARKTLISVNMLVGKQMSGQMRS